MRQSIKHIISKSKMQPRIGSAIDDIQSANKNDYNNTIVAITELLAKSREYGVELQKLASQSNQLEEANRGLQETFGMNIESSTLFGARLDSISKQMGVGGANLRKYTGDLKGLIGSFAGSDKILSTYGKTLLRSTTVIQGQLKLSAEVANKFIQYSAMFKEDSDGMILRYSNIAKSINSVAGMQTSARDLIADTAGLTEDLQLQYGKIPERLVMANLKAKALGLTMSDLNKTGQNLLNIESSIGDELEYQLLSGRRLVDEVSGESLTNAYRTATIQGDANKQAMVMNTILKQEGKTLRNNLFARQQMAKTLGTDEATLGRSLAKQELLAKIGAEGFMDLSLDKLQGSLADLPEFKKMNDEKKSEFLQTLTATFDTRTTEEKQLDALNSIVSNGIVAYTTPESLAAAAQMRSTEFTNIPAQGAQELISGTEIGSNAVPSAGALMGIGQDINAARTVITAANKAVDLFQKVLSGDILLKTTSPWVVRTTGDVNLNAEGVAGNDVMLEAGSSRAILGPEGMINLNSKDTIIAGTNLMGSNSTSGPDLSAFANAIVAAINNQTSALTSNSGINAPYWS